MRLGKKVVVDLDIVSWGCRLLRRAIEYIAIRITRASAYSRTILGVCSRIILGFCVSADPVEPSSWDPGMMDGLLVLNKITLKASAKGIIK
jgi:hypothetical protein